MIIAEERAGDLQQAVAQRRGIGGGEQRVGQLLFAMRLHGRGEQRLLVAEVAVDGELGDAGLGRDLVHAHAGEALRGEQALGRFEDRGALAQVLRAARGRLRLLGRRGPAWRWRFGSWHASHYKQILD